MCKNKIYNKTTAFIILFLVSINSFSQEYRTPKAYLQDFLRNEVFVNAAMMQYSKSIIDLSPDNRKQETLDKLVDKLENINQTLYKIDSGLKNDVSLRDAFIELNNKVIYYIKNDLLNLKDYIEQSNLSLEEININFVKKENNIKDFFAKIYKYDSIKVQFAKRNKVILNIKNKKNIFEYNALLNLIFYKLNTLDNKLINAIENKNRNEIIEANQQLVLCAYDDLKSLKLLESAYTDKSLNDSTKELIYFFLKQSDELVITTLNFINFYFEFQKIKEFAALSNDATVIEEYNIQVRKYNQLKNNFYEIVNKSQSQKELLKNAWFISNSKFLINNIDFDNINPIDKK